MSILGKIPRAIQDILCHYNIFVICTPTCTCIYIVAITCLAFEVKALRKKPLHHI